MVNPDDDSHSLSLESWVESANDPQTPFPIQNLPFGRFRRAGEKDWALGVAIGDQVLDLKRAGVLESIGGDASDVLTLPSARRQGLRQQLSQGLRRGGSGRQRLESALVPTQAVELGTPCDIRNYSDFFIGIHHAANTGRLYRPETPLLPNYRWVPIGYHGRASTIRASGHDLHRPNGQVMAPGAQAPRLQPTGKLDFELEMGILVSRPNVQGNPVGIEDAEEHIFGLTLLNDWSARDVQSWEAQPLGPFLAKSFATTISPWVVTLEALAPFRRSFVRPEGEPQPLPYLESRRNRDSGAVDVHLEVWLRTARMRAEGQEAACIARSNFAEAAYWTMAQLVTHQTVNGCSLEAGDLLGTGTLSADKPGGAACLLEITEGGKRSLTLPNGEERLFLQDGDTVTLRGHCERPGYRRIGFGECTATVVA